MKKLTLIFSCLFCFNFSSFSQVYEEFNTQKFPNKIFIELAGQGKVYSINYERFYYSSREWNTSLRLGAAYLGEELVFPIGYNINQILKENHQFSAGPAITLFIDYTKNRFTSNIFDRFLRNSGANFGGNIGYHYSNEDTDISLGIVMTPLVHFYDFRNPTFNITGGIRVGYHFE